MQVVLCKIPLEGGILNLLALSSGNPNRSLLWGMSSSPCFVLTDTLGGVNQRKKKSVRGAQRLGNTVSVDVCGLWLMPSDFPSGSSNGCV